MLKTSIQNKYLKRAKLASFILQLAPFVRMIGLNGSLACGQANEHSDIDFIIIVKTGRIWSCRAFTVLVMAALGFKRYKNKIAGRVCLNLYQTEDHLLLTTKNAFLARNHACTMPLYAQGEIFKRFIKANKWIQDFGQKFHVQVYRSSFTNYIILGIQRLGEFIFELILADWGERVLKNYQTKRILSDPRTKNSPRGAIFISDYELRFHPPKIKS